jgi:endonuclease VIII
MPEGDTIRRLADRINARFAGHRCTRCITRDPRLVGFDAAGSTLVEADAFGKHLFLRFDDGRTVHAHLLMDGRVVVGPASRDPQWRRRLELWFEDGRLTAVDVPVLGVIPTDRETDVTGHLGPDLCGAIAPDPATVVERVRRDPDAPLAGALLDQRNVAGFGNVYAVELPFIVGVNPNQRVGAIDGLEALFAIGTPMIRLHAAGGPRNTTGRRLNTADHFVYGRRACPQCATRLEEWTDADSPWGRASTWCPTCQPIEPRRAVDVVRAKRLLALHPVRRDPMFTSAFSADR